MAEIYDANPQIKPTAAQQLILKKMQAEGLHETFGRDYPGVSTVSKELKRLRDIDAARSTESKGLDVEWTIQSLSKYPIAPDALPSVLNAWFETQSLKSEFRQVPSMTIRQARWVARLYCVIKDTKALLGYSMIMADFERQAEVAGLDYFASQWTTLEVFGKLTDRTFSHEEMEGITGLSGHYVTRVGLDKLRSRAKETNK